MVALGATHVKRILEVSKRMHGSAVEHLSQLNRLQGCFEVPKLAVFDHPETLLSTLLP